MREGMESTEAVEFREQYARAREGNPADAHSSAAWHVARDACHRHTLGGCPGCYPRGNRHCDIDAELGARYDHETHAWEARNEESGA